MKGKFVSCKANVMILADDAGKNTSHDVDPSASVTLNGKPAKMADLKGGDSVTLSGDPATSVTATR